MQTSSRMSLKLIRITRLKQFFAQRGVEDLSSRASLIGKKPNQASDLLTGKASFGEKVARSIEEHSELPLGWLDHLGDSTEEPNIKPTPAGALTPADLVVQLANIFAPLDKLTRAQIKPIFNQLVEAPEQAAELGQRLEATVALTQQAQTSSAIAHVK